MNETFIVYQDHVLNEVAKTTSYTGSKMEDEDKMAYKRIFTKDADRTMLLQFWTEAADALTDQLKPFIIMPADRPADATADDFVMTLQMSVAWDTSLKDSMQSSMKFFFIKYIVSQWFKFTNKKEAEDYATEATGMIKDVLSKAYYRKKPIRHKPVRN